MSDGRTHPHIESPSEEQIEGVLEERPADLRGIYVAAHRMVLDALPGVAYALDVVDGEMGYGARQYGYDGWGMLALTPYSNWVSLAFFKGADLEGGEGLLEGSGRTIRHVKLRTAEDLSSNRERLRYLIGEASRLLAG